MFSYASSVIQMFLRQIWSNKHKDMDKFNLILDLINSQIVDLIFKKVTGLNYTII